MQIHSYIFKKTSKSCLSIAGGLLLILLTMQLIAQNDLLIKGTVGFSQLILLAALSASEFTLFLLIIGFACALRLNCVRLAADNEWMVLQSTGFSYRQILYPFYLLLMLVLGASYVMSLFIIPEALYFKKQKLHDYKNQAFRNQLVTGRFYEPEKNFILHIGDSDNQKAQIYNVYMHDRRQKPGYVLTAKQGQFWQTEQGLKIQFTSGSYYYLEQNDVSKQQDLHLIDFGELWVDATGITNEQSEEDQQKIIRDKIKILRTDHLLASFYGQELAENLRGDYQRELQKRFNLPLLAASLAGFLLCLPINAIARQKRNIVKRFLEFYGTIIACILLILLQLIFIGGGNMVMLWLSYIFPFIMLALPFWLKVNR
ncbi:MAG: LptF/LptG family permease [Alphaproteobacteria bacterium]|nr:LptF/LptG family permease [Alphaproteobacteria bacterium]